MRMKETSALIKSPIRNLLPLSVNSIAEKSGFPNSRDQGRNQSVDPRRNERAKGRTHYHGNGKIKNISAQHKLFEALQHLTLPYAVRCVVTHGALPFVP